MDTPGSTASLGRMLLIILVIALVALAGTLEVKRRVAEQQLQQLTMRLEQLQTGGSSENRAEAQRVINKVKKLMKINEEVTPTVATIVDVAALRQRNPFYNKAENGDFLVVTPDRAILYNEKKNIILDVVPVQIQPVKPGAQSSVPGQK